MEYIVIIDLNIILITINIRSMLDNIALVMSARYRLCQGQISAEGDEGVLTV